MYEQTQTFIDSLTQWNNERLSNVQDFQSLIMLLGIQIGEPWPVLERTTVDEDLKTLQHRIEYLVSHQEVSEDLLVNGLVEETTSLLKRLITGHGESILYFEEIAEKFGDDSVAKRKLDELKNPEYIINTRSELALWSRIVSQQHSEYQRHIWNSQRLLEKSNMAIRGLKSIPTEIQDILFDYPMGKLKDYVSPDEMSTLTVEQALEIKSKIDQSEK